MTHGGVHRQVPRRQSFGTCRCRPRRPAARRVQPRLAGEAPFADSGI